MTAQFTYEDAKRELMALSYTLAESAMTVSRGSVEHTIKSHKLENGQSGDIEIYSRRQYANDRPEVGLLVKAWGMSYGGTDSNYKCYSLEELLWNINPTI